MQSPALRWLYAVRGRRSLIIAVFRDKNLHRIQLECRQSCATRLKLWLKLVWVKKGLMVGNARTPATPQRRKKRRFALWNRHEAISCNPCRARCLRPRPNCLLRELCGTLFGLPRSLPLETAFCRDFAAELQGPSPQLPACLSLSLHFPIEFCTCGEYRNGSISQKGSTGRSSTVILSKLMDDLFLN